MLQVAWIFVWLTAGVFLEKAFRAAFPSRALNQTLIWISLPATILLMIHNLNWSSQNWVPISMAWIVFGLSVPTFLVLGKLNGWNRGSIGALILTAGLGNTSFIGFPLLRALYGERALSVAVLNDQPGSFLVLATLGIATASLFSAKRASWKTVLFRIVRFPPIWATLAAFALRPLAFPRELELILAWGMRSLIPLALISVGAQLEFRKNLFQRELSPLISGLVYKLVVAPLFIGLIFVILLHNRGESIRITILEAAMGPMITGAIVAREYSLDPELCSLLITVGIPLCLVSVPLWARLLYALNV